MSDDEKFRESSERLRARIEALKNAPPLEKARTFLRDFCAATSGLPEIEEQIRFSLGFNSIPVWTGLEGLEAVLSDDSLEPATLVSLVRQDANQLKVPPTPEAARAFLTKLVEILRRELAVEDEVEGEPFFEPGGVYTLPDAEGAPGRLRNIDMLRVGDENFALFVPEHARDEEGPYTVYRYQVTPEPRMTYERVTEPELVAGVLHAHRTYGQPEGK
ncbi:hypothetical protein [Archangium lansingense]|uniref:Uncharacterized protein n=1 Tax=Archangium lansingense TaxID=2995310 RepID=A0ABT4A474_9BACT|nr:hypothetical protein [Archangium lansinium]MCY1076445.1 hypothetical protein [Archangium lansinium]